MNDPLLFGLSLAFLLGVVLAAASVVPALRERYPRLMLQGFLLAVGAILAAFVVALLRG